MKPGLLYQSRAGRGSWIIYDLDGPGLFGGKKPVILWSRLGSLDEDTQERAWPADMRAEYERILGRGEFSEMPEMPEMPNLVELVADEDECAWDQKCSHGYRVENHAVYCHNERWLYAPTKCRRGEWLARIFGGDPSGYAHEKCPGFMPNPLYKPT